MISVAFTTSLINGLLPEPHAGLLSGMLFGVRGALAPSLYEDMVRTGTLHIVALSGMNITILITLTDMSLLKFVSKRIASLLTILFIGCFVWFVGPSASVVRAALMGTITLLAVVFGRHAWALWSWVLAVGIMLMLNPVYIGDVSFQLSVMATLGIILFGREKEQVTRGAETALWERARQVIEADLRVTLAAQAFTIPIILFSFHRISLIAPISNLLIGWVVPMVTGVGLLMSVMGYVFRPLAELLAWIVWVPLQFILVVVGILSRVPFASIGG